MSAHICILMGVLVTIIPTYRVQALRLLDEDLNNILDILKPAIDSGGKVKHNNEHLSDTSILKLLVQAANNLQATGNNRHNSKNDHRHTLDNDIDGSNSVNLNQLPLLYKYLASSLNELDNTRNDAKQDANYDLNSPSNKNLDDKLDLNDYSKIYLMLDPKANLKHKDIIEISSLVSSVFKSDSNDKRYKGFVVRDNSRRRRNSKESYSKRDSMEHDYKPKRARKEHQGGGRTAIPYIRQRGDIYEKPSEFN